MGKHSSARKRWIRGVLLALLGLIGWAMTQTGSAQALPPYPSPPPDFSHPGSFHNSPWGANDPVYGTLGGQRDREMLVVLPQFSDVADTPGAGEAWAANRFFGGFPSVANWFNAMSGGDLILTPAAETGGTANNGVVIVDAGTFSSFEGLNDQQRSRRVLELANASVNFASFDDNNDGRIDDLELTVVSVRTGNPIADDPATPVNEANPDNCGAARTSEGATYDGRTLTGITVSLNTTLTNLMTLIHEVGHQTTHMRDLYGFGVGAWALSGPTCGPPDNLLFGPNGWERVHFGWGTPNVVVQDGYYDIADTATGAQPYYILYDPSKGTEDYFVVENRQRTANSYEQSASDSGLAIWRSDDSVWESGSDATRPIDIMRPDGATTAGCGDDGCYGGSTTDAWNPCDGSTPQRTMSRPWRDGTASNLAVRAIGCSGSTIRAYFDVRGPGVLVDATNAQAGTRTVPVVPTEASPVTFAVMNTGEATDTFDFTVQGLPPGWTASTDRKTLTAGAGSTANVTVTPPADAAVDTFDVTVVGRSTTATGISSTSPLRLFVDLHDTELKYTGDSSQPWGEGAGFSATVRDEEAGLAPIVGAPVTFRLSGPGGSQEVTATSDATGTARANPAITLPPGEYQLMVNLPRFGKHRGVTLQGIDYTVERRATTIDYTGVTTAEYSDPAALSTVLTDAISGAALPGMTIGFTLGTQSGSGTTDAAGSAGTTIVVDQPASTSTVAASFAGTGSYLPSTDSTAFVIDEEDLTLVYTGDTLVERGTTPRLAAQATQENDGSPGSFTLAQIQFDLTPTLSSTPYRFAAPANASGAASTPATGLPVDLWKVKPSIPVANAYWEGTGPEVELVHYDERAKVTGIGVFGPDSGGKQTQLTVTGSYLLGKPVGATEFLSSQGLFMGLHNDWIVRVGKQAIVQAQGRVGLSTPATLRLRLADNGLILSRRDWFEATLTRSSGVYQSGRVVPTIGDLWVH